jgi:repressor LexA
MNIIALRIKERREQLGLSAEQLAEKIGKAKTTIYRYESGFIEKMPSSVLSDIAKALNVSPTYLMGLEDSTSITDQIRPIRLKKFRILGEIACGEPIFANEDHETYIDASAEIKADFFGDFAFGWVAAVCKICSSIFFAFAATAIFKKKEAVVSGELGL